MGQESDGSGLRRRRIKFRALVIWLAATLGVTVVVWLLSPLCLMGEWYRRVPRELDGRLVGTWSDGKTTVVLDADGTGKSVRKKARERRFDWGIEEGAMRVKYMSVDAYIFPLLRYSVSPNGKELSFIGSTNHSMFPARLHRILVAGKQEPLIH